MERHLILRIFLLVLFGIQCFVSGYPQDSGLAVNSSTVFKSFDPLFKVDPRLVSGDFYQTPAMGASTGHPYFMDPNWKSGWLVLDGIRFDNLLLRYDISSNQLILNTVNLTDSYLQVVLKKDQISSFMMDGHLFRPFPVPLPTTGLRFCEVLVDGDPGFVWVQSKSLKVSSGGSSDYIYQSSKGRYLLLDEQLILYHGRRTLYRYFPEYKNAIRGILKERHLLLKMIPLATHAELVQMCKTSLTKMP